MKLTVFLLTAGFLNVSAKGLSQNVTFSGKNVPLKSVFSSVEKQTGFLFFYPETVLHVSKPVSINVHDLSLDEFLSQIFKSQPLKYTIKGESIFVSPKVASPVFSEPQLTNTTSDFKDTLTDVRGKVVNENGEPLAGVNIVVKGTSRGTSTDSNGVFVLRRVDNNAVLLVSSVGSEQRVINVKGQSSFSIVLKPADAKLEETVVIGYGTAKKRDVTGAVSSVTAKDFNQGAITDAMQQVAGKVPGLVITTSGGDPNQNIQIRLRGQASLTGNQVPLIVVDGVQLPDPNLLSNISPSDIISYDVLKDASASAIYGARGANGVIIIQTKKGKAGKVQIDYSGVVGLNKVAKKFDLLNGPEYTAAGGKVTNYLGSPIPANTNTDWQGVMLRKSLSTTHNLGISGGTGDFSYRASVNYIKQDGIMINSSKELYGISLSGQQKALNNKLVINLGINVTRVNRQFLDYNMIFGAWNMSPLVPAYDSAGGLYPYRNGYAQFNPLALKMESNNEIDQTSLWNGSADYELIKGLKVGGRGALFYSTKQNHNYYPSSLMPGYPTPSTGSQSSTNNYSTNGEVHLQFDRSFGKHSINAIGAYEYNNIGTDAFKANGSNYLYDLNSYNNLGAGNPSLNGISSSKSAYKLISFLGRALYNYDARYYLTLILRRDGSDKFGTGHQWGYFPSISAAWRVSNEDFIKNISWINDLKLSVGWGNTGNSEGLVPYQSLQLLGSNGNYYNPGNPQFLFPPAYSLTQNANPDLKWETRQGVNYAVDFALFKNRLTGSINVFSDKTKNLLYNYNVPTPPFFVNNIWANVGSLTNKGVEIALNGNIIQTKDINWSLGGQISFVKTRVASLSGDYNGYNVATDKIGVGSFQLGGRGGGTVTYLKVGYSPSVFYLAHYVGLDPAGVEQFDDGSGHGGKVTASGLLDSMSRYTDPSPKFTYGFNTNLSYKQLSLNLTFRGISGVKYYDASRQQVDNYAGLQDGNISKRGLASGDKTSSFTYSDKWVENGSFLRLDNLTLSYRFKNTGEHIDNLRLFFTGNNLFVITKYTGLDPEVQTATAAAYIDINSLSGAVNSAYYKARSFNMGVNITFK